MKKVTLTQKIALGLGAVAAMASNAAAAADIAVTVDPQGTVNLWYAVGIMAGVLITFAVGKKVLAYFRG